MQAMMVLSSIDWLPEGMDDRAGSQGKLFK
jgi:hypothetical protein